MQFNNVTAQVISVLVQL